MNIRSISFLVLMLLMASSVLAFAPNGGKVTTLNVNTVNQSLATDKQYMIDSSTACKLRLKRNSSVANANVTQISLRANETVILDVNPSTPFANLSGCTGSLVRQ